MPSTTQTEERERWRARILRALAELQSGDAPMLDGGEAAADDGDGDGRRSALDP